MSLHTHELGFGVSLPGRAEQINLEAGRKGLLRPYVSVSEVPVVNTENSRRDALAIRGIGEARRAALAAEGVYQQFESGDWGLPEPAADIKH